MAEVFAARSERFDAWVAPMAARAQPWRVAGGVIVAGALWMAAMLSAVGITAWAGAGARGQIVAFLLSFGALIAGFGLVMRRFHRLPGARLLGPEGWIEARPLLAGLAVVAAVAGLGLASLVVAGPPVRQQGLADWAVWLPAVLPALFLQATAEEVAFRGYLQGMLAARFRNRLVWWVLPAAVFGALHWNPGEFGANAHLVVAAAALMGLVLGDVTARTGSLSLAIGLHLGNNAVGLLLVATPSALSDFALYLSPVDTGDPATMRAGLLANMGLIAAVWGVWLLVRWRRARRGR